MWLIQLRINFLTWRKQALFKGEKQPISSGCSRYNKYSGIQRHIILLSLQYSSNSTELQLLWPSKLNRQQVPYTLFFYIHVKMLNPRDTKLIYCLAVLRDPKTPFRRQLFLYIPAVKIDFRLVDNKQWNLFAYRANPQDY